MIPIHDLINKIKWDKNEKEEEYVINYEDRKIGKMIEVKFIDITKVEDGFMTIERENLEVQIPLHRIKIVKKKGEIIWQR